MDELKLEVNSRRNSPLQRMAAQPEPVAQRAGGLQEFEPNGGSVSAGGTLRHQGRMAMAFLHAA
jgi:hypothetical protein